jgi:hypothetical protein
MDVAQMRENMLSPNVAIVALPFPSPSQYAIQNCCDVVHVLAVHVPAY